MGRHYDIAAYIWPAFQSNEVRADIFWPMGIGEWETIMKSKPRFDGHLQPRKPLWGYVNEADPYVMEMEINAAADHGVNVFIYDWYWYDRRPYLESCLNDGYLKARNNDRVKFYLMWANHGGGTTWNLELSDRGDTIVWDGRVDRHEFEIVCNRLINKYFLHPSYYKIDGKPVFLIYEVQNLIRGLGGVDATKSAIEWFRNQVVKAGLPGLHLQMTMVGEKNYNLSGVDGGNTATSSEVAQLIDFDSMTNYQFCHITDINRDYNEIMADVLKEWARFDTEYKVPFYPHISVGWDSNPRFKKVTHGLIKNNTPENVQKAFEHAKAYADAHPEQAPLITVNSWNEWSETSYLQPDNIYGYGYLEAIKKVFAK
jgi:hypothetical protein